MNQQCYYAFIGTNSVRGSQGIYTLAIEREDFSARILHTRDFYNAGALALDSARNRLFAASEGMVFQGAASGGVVSFAIGDDGQLTRLGQTLSGGQRPCNLAVAPEGSTVYATNFFGGSLAMIPVEQDGSLLPARQVVISPKPELWMHAMHCVAVLEGGKALAVMNVSQSALSVYSTADGGLLDEFPFGDHRFPRTVTTRGNRIYAMLQDPGDIFLLEWDGTRLTHRQTLRMQPPPPDFYGTSALKLTPNGRLLLAGARCTNTIAVFSVAQDGTLTQASTLHLPGQTPRDFAISPDGQLVVTALQASDQVCVHKIDYDRGILVQVGDMISIPSPAAVAILERR